MAQGLIYVGSKVTRPNKLSDEDFCKWYEEIHIDQVCALSGVTAAARYEALPLPEPIAVPPPEDKKPYDWLTLYEMPDIEFRETKEFKGLDGQSVPKKELLEGVFKNACFETRFYQEIQRDEIEGAKTGEFKPFQCIDRWGMISLDLLGYRT
jgi:hypothetical protein